MSRRFLIAGNWKMNLGGKGACELAAEIAVGAAHFPTVDVVVAPPFTAIAAVSAELDGQRVAVGGQNLHPSPNGAFTGEISGSMLAECGASWVIHLLLLCRPMCQKRSISASSGLT